MKRLNREAVAALGSDDVTKKLRAIGAEPFPGTPEQTRARMKSDIARWRKVIEQAKIERQ